MQNLFENLPLYFTYGLTFLIGYGLFRSYISRKRERRLELVKRPQSNRPPLVDDPEALALAEAEVAEGGAYTVREGYVMVARFSSHHGYTDQQLVDMISLLGQKDIPASYSKHTWAAMGDSYNLQVPAEKAERALTLLKQAGYRI